MQRYIPLLLVLVMGACADERDTDTPFEPSFAVQRLDQYNEREPFSMTLLYTCSAPTELVHLSGTLHTVSQMHLDGSGVQHWSFHSHPIGLRGVGAISGRQFKVVGTENTTRKMQSDGHRRFRQIASLRLMSPREPTWTLRIHVDREGRPGDWEYRIDKFEIDCQ